MFLSWFFLSFSITKHQLRMGGGKKGGRFLISPGSLFLFKLSTHIAPQRTVIQKGGMWYN
jgi:hypothetical protein